jgi:pyrroline-5-carboxylate reductase
MALQGTLGFLGFGNMGRAILGGLLETGTLSQKHAIIYDVLPERCADAEHLGVAVAESQESLGKSCDLLMLAVKPQNMEEALEAVKPGLSSETLIISIAAGISSAYIQERLGPDFRVVRVMPNTPALVGAGAAGIAMSANCREEDAEAARTIFEAVGIAEMFPEDAIDAVTALSGSGPAYFFNMVECLVRAAVDQGLPEDKATRLAAQTLLGAGRLLLESGESAETLRQRVTSKGGTTEAALKRFGEEGFERVIAAGVAAATARSRELGK